MNLEWLLALPDPSFLIGTDGVIRGANAAVGEFLGASLDSLVGQSVMGMVTEPEAVTLQFLHICSRSRQALPGALTWKHRDGTLIEMRCDGAVVQPAGKGGQALVYVRCRPKQESITQFVALNEKIRTLSREIQERRRVEIALHASEERYRTLVAATSTIVWSTDLHGLFKEPQPSWGAYTGQSRDEYYGLGFLQAVHPEDRGRVEDCWRECLRDGSFFECDLRLWHGDSGSYHLCLCRATAVRDSENRIREWVGTITDIEERKKLDEQLRQTQKLESLGVLAGGVAHDFNNLLVGILGNASLALETISANSPARSMLQDVVSASESAAHLTKQLLAYAGKGRFVIEPVDISDLIRQIHTLIQTSIPRTVQLRLELQDHLPCVDADLSQIQQVIMNLIINGAEAIGETQTGTVLVTTGVQDIDEGYIHTTLASEQVDPGQYVMIEVHDTGSGMAPDVIAKIFDPFFTTKFTGRGLGLAAVLGIVRGHRGVIKVYSMPGRGTTFKVLFPTTTRLVIPAAGLPAPAIRRPTFTVLVIDDERVVRQTAKAMLERFDYEVILAENGKEGVEVFKCLADKITVVLLDMTMPVMSGEDTFRELRGLKSDVRVILSSGYNEVEAIRRFTGKGLAGFLQKPYSAASLRQKIEGAIDDDQRDAGRG